MGERTQGPAAGKRDWILLVAILCATAAVYARGLSGELVYDDRLLIARNPLIADLGNLPRLFTSGYWDFLDLREAQYIGYWRPLTAIVQALVWPFAGSRPGPYHAACLAIHLGAVGAAFFLARRLSASAWIAAATALLFALHPAHVESVAWISALNDPLFGCLALLSIERFLAWRARGSRGVPLVSLLAFSLALLAKELAAALVPLLVLLDLLRPQEERREPAPAGWPARLSGWLTPPLAPVRAYGPFAAAFAAYMVARMLVFASPWAGFERVTTDFGVGTLRLLQLRLELFGGALEILCLPIELNLFRPFRPAIAPLDPALVRAAAFTTVYLALLAASFLGRRRLALAALLVVLAGFLPALIKVQSLGIFPLSERFLYLPVFGFALGTALLLRHAFPSRTATLLVLVLGGLYAARSAARVGVFRDEETLFRDAALRSPRSVYVQWGLGRVLLERFGATHDARYLAEAKAVFEEAEKLLLEAKQEDTDLMVTSRDYLQVNLGFAYCSIFGQELAGAIASLEQLAQRIEEIQGQEREARALGIRVREQFLDMERVYTALGTAHAAAGHLAEAEQAYRRALELQPAAIETHRSLGQLYVKQERFGEAAQEFDAALRLAPGDPETRLLLAQALQMDGQKERADALARELLQELPGRAEPLVVLATGALRHKETAQALAWLDRALAIQPRDANAWYQKALASLLRNDTRGALIAFRNAVEIDPTSFLAHYNCAALLQSQGAVAEALPYLVRAYTVSPPQHREALRGELARLELEDAGQLFELARADEGRNDLAHALEWLEKLFALQPDHDPALLMKARILRRLERHEEALPLLRAAAARHPRDFELWSDLAGYLHGLGREEESRPVIERALELEPPAAWPPELRESSRERLRAMLGAQTAGEPLPAPEQR